MKVRHTLIALLVLGLFLAPCIQYTAAETGYHTLYQNWVANDSIVTVTVESMGSYYLKVLVTNGSGYANVTLSGPSLPDQYKGSRAIYEGSDSTYPGLFRVYVADIKNDTAYIVVDGFAESSSTASGTKVSCDTPGLTALGGDVVSFPLVIQNNDHSDHTYELSSFSDVSWRTWFEYGGKGVYLISVPASSSRTVNLMVQTWGNTPVGKKQVVAYVDKIRTEVYVDITSSNKSADVSVKVSSKIAYIGDKISYDLHIKNTQAKENLYRLAVTGLPENWYYRYKETVASTEEMAEVIVPASSEKDLVLEIVPPYSVGVGDYSFTAVVTTPDNVSITKDLTLTLKSGTGMSATSSMYAYEAKAGEAFNIVLYVTNTGQGTALTNVYLETSAPEGWLIQVSPNRTNSIKAGGSQAFTITVQPPGNIAASDYEVNVKVKSDQAQSEKTYRVKINVSSIVPYLGAGIIVLVVGGLFLIYRKYGRR